MKESEDEAPRYSIVKNCILSSSTNLIQMTTYVAKRLWLSLTFVLCPFSTSPVPNPVFEPPSDIDTDSDSPEEDPEDPENEEVQKEEDQYKDE